MKQRIKNLFPHNGLFETDDSVPRGWITPQGQFLKTKEHWASINSHFRRPDTRAKTSEEAGEELIQAEKTAHLAYSLGWISVGHAGKLNAIGHQRTFWKNNHPAVVTLRKLLSEVPEITISIEIQIGDYIPSRGVHEDFELKTFDLDILVKRGKLRQAHRS